MIGINNSLRDDMTAIIVLGVLTIAFVVLMGATFANGAVAIPSGIAAACYMAALVSGLWRSTHPAE